MLIKNSQKILSLKQLVILLLCAHVGGALIMVSLKTYHTLVIAGAPLGVLWQELGGSSFWLLILAMSVLSCTIGLGYVHVILAYAFFLRWIPDFWISLKRYFLSLFLGTFAADAAFMHLRGGATALLEALVGITPIAFWITAIYLTIRHRKAPKGQEP